MTTSTAAYERTALAWRRTVVSAIGTAALFINHAMVGGWRAAAAAPLIGAVMLMVLAAIAYRRNLTLRHLSLGRPGPAIIASTVTITIVCVVALEIVVRTPRI